MNEGRVGFVTYMSQTVFTFLCCDHFMNSFYNIVCIVRCVYTIINFPLHHLHTIVFEEMIVYRIKLSILVNLITNDELLDCIRDAGGWDDKLFGDYHSIRKTKNLCVKTPN